jgi:hypothetical protein
MSLDARVRDALERSSLIVDPDVRRDLATVRRKTRRAIIRQRVGLTVLAACVIAAAVFLGPRVLDVIRSQRQRPASSPSPSVLAGSYRVDLSGAGGSLSAAGLEGRWSITLEGDGSVLWHAPSGPPEGLPRDTYQVSGDSIVTNLFANDLCRGSGVGSYSWNLSGGTLTFVAVSDGCDVRRAVLTSGPWARM